MSGMNVEDDVWTGSETRPDPSLVSQNFLDDRGWYGLSPTRFFVPTAPTTLVRSVSLLKESTKSLITLFVRSRTGVSTAVGRLSRPSGLQTRGGFHDHLCVSRSQKKLRTNDTQWTPTETNLVEHYTDDFTKTDPSNPALGSKRPTQTCPDTHFLVNRTLTPTLPRY